MTEWMQILMAGGSLIAALSSALAAWLLYGVAKAQSEHTRLLAEAETRPLVVLSIRLSSRGAHWPELVVQNVGRSTAYLVQFDAQWNALEKLLGRSACDWLRGGITCLTPGASLIHDLDELVNCTDADPSKHSGNLPCGEEQVLIRYQLEPRGTKPIEVLQVISLRQLFGLQIETNSDPARLLCDAVRRLDNTAVRIEHAWKASKEYSAKS